MAAVSAARCNLALKTFYDRLIARGKKAKVALTAVMRKLVVLANTLAPKTDFGSHVMLDSHHRCSVDIHR